MAIASDQYAAAATLVRNRVHLRVVDFVRANPRAHVVDILNGTGIPQGTLGRVLRALVDINVLTVDVPPEKRSSANRFRYTVDEDRIDELLATLYDTFTP
ncbi:hypothetical protein [Microbacterium phyllosphaerae]|uniref:hypothetical protein n=1 Tax=Microbacterium phyllosphaerae TaxID=124798 RepID=UPI0021680D74|nr:hypothetical protein [Microbacterium phyllosphaerae]MCS3442158.1 hypothetical protein [Microbacterium phyllosphaerae]